MPHPTLKSLREGLEQQLSGSEVLLFFRPELVPITHIGQLTTASSGSNAFVSNCTHGHINARVYAHTQI